MKIINKILNTIYNHQKIVEFVIITLFCTLISFQVDSKGMKLYLHDFPAVTIFIALIFVLFILIWIKIEKRKTRILIENLKNTDREEHDVIAAKLNELSIRQREVFKLILTGKSNKEILTELNIEMSTLKTHINQIYKILGIKNRKDAKRLENQIVNNK